MEERADLQRAKDDKTDTAYKRRRFCWFILTCLSGLAFSPPAVRGMRWRQTRDWYHFPCSARVASMMLPRATRRSVKLSVSVL